MRSWLNLLRLLCFPTRLPHALFRDFSGRVDEPPALAAKAASQCRLCPASLLLSWREPECLPAAGQVQSGRCSDPARCSLQQLSKSAFSAEAGGGFRVRWEWGWAFKKSAFVFGMPDGWPTLKKLTSCFHIGCIGPHGCDFFLPS